MNVTSTSADSSTGTELQLRYGMLAHIIRTFDGSHAVGNESFGKKHYEISVFDKVAHGLPDEHCSISASARLVRAQRVEEPKKESDTFRFEVG